MRVITFYSYKGGVGRTLAAANFAVYLAKLGLKTVIIDFDLEAPGIDAKFSLPALTGDQRGVLDYILEFQETNQGSGNIKQLCRKVPLDDSEDAANLWLIPAGQYLSENYYQKLNRLDWGLIFSNQRNGVAFFQQFLSHLKQELNAEFVIIDSRTGITEIAGLCTQQLADEVVMLSSLSSESIRVTKHIKQLIQNSQVAKALDKSIDVKIVVSRIPKPETLIEFKSKCCEIFEVNENKLFFLFSCPTLELEEFLAISQADKDEELVSNYVRLFYGLNIEIADEKIKQEVVKLTQEILLLRPEEAEKEIIELTAIYQHPEVYRTAMRFFQLTKDIEQTKQFSRKLHNLVPEDEEAQLVLAKSYLYSVIIDDQYEAQIKDAIQAIDQVWQKQQLEPNEILRYAQFLEISKLYVDSLKVSQYLYRMPNLDNELRKRAYAVASRSAERLGDKELAEELSNKAKESKLNLRRFGRS